MEGFFVTTPDDRVTHVNTSIPLALLTLEAYQLGRLDEMPRHPSPPSFQQW